MNREEERRTAAKVNLEETFTFLDQIIIEGFKGIIRSPYPTINGLNVQLKKGERAFDFETGDLMPGTQPALYQDVKYGFAKPFTIDVSGKEFKVEKGVGSASSKLANGLSTTGGIYELDTMNKTTSGYFRAVLSLAKFMKWPLQFIIGKHFLVGSALRAAGYIIVKVNNREFAFYNYDHEKTNYIFIDSLEPIDFNLFSNVVEHILFSYALISGSLIQNEILFLKSTAKDFSELDEFYFERIRDSIDSWVELISPRDHKDVKQLAKTEYLDESVFSRLVELCTNNKQMMRAVRMITQAKNSPPELEAAAVFVALETVKEIIIEEHREKVKSFINETVAKSVIKEFIERIELISDTEFLNKKRVLNKIEQLNSIGNNESFTMAFELAGIELTKEEKEFVKKRNQFLHGSIPFEDEEKDKTTMELHKVVLHMHMLTGALILKYVGYSGHVLNYWRYWEIQRGDSKNLDGLFRDI